MQPKILIVGAVPYNTKATSRSFAAYFSGWEKEKLAQIFSHTKTPCKGHCETLYQITDKKMLKRRFKKGAETGRIFEYEDLPLEWEDTSLEVGDSLFNALYRIGSKRTPLVHLFRKFIWKKKYWKTEKLDRWLEAFAPDCVFLNISSDFYLQEIALYAADKFDIPIVSAVVDDYYFNTHCSLSPFYAFYKSAYRKQLRNLFKRKGSRAVYISDKIKDKYKQEFSLEGETVYLTSTVERKPFSYIDKKKPLITYFGNIRMGRNKSLNDIATALGEIDSSYTLEIYSNETNKKYYGLFEKNPNAKFGGSIPYTQVQEKMANSDITIVVEGFTQKDLSLSRYSLSTKAADALSSGAAILAFGSSDCGVIEYLQSTGAACVCTDKAELVNCIRGLLEDTDGQKARYDRAIEVTEQNHNLQSSTDIFSKIVKQAIDAYKGDEVE